MLGSKIRATWLKNLLEGRDQDSCVLFFSFAPFIAYWSASCMKLEAGQDWAVCGHRGTVADPLDAGSTKHSAFCCIYAKNKFLEMNILALYFLVWRVSICNILNIWHVVVNKAVK